MAVGAGQRDSGLRGPGVLGHVLQRLQDAEVRGGLGVAPVAPDSVRLDQDRKRGPAGLGRHRGRQSLVGQQRRVDTAGQGPQVVQGRVQPGPELAGHLPDLTGVIGGVVEQPELDVERDQLLLGAVVQVPLDPLALGVLRFHQPSSGRPQLVDGGLQLGGQRGVAQDEARLRRQVPQQLSSAAGQRLIPGLLQGQCAKQLAAMPDSYRVRCLLEGRKPAVGVEHDGGGWG